MAPIKGPQRLLARTNVVRSQHIPCHNASSGAERCCSHRSQVRRLCRKPLPQASPQVSGQVPLPQALPQISAFARGLRSGAFATRGLPQVSGQAPQVLSQSLVPETSGHAQSSSQAVSSTLLHTLIRELGFKAPMRIPLGFLGCKFSGLKGAIRGPTLRRSNRHW